MVYLARTRIEEDNSPDVVIGRPFVRRPVSAAAVSSTFSRPISVVSSLSLSPTPLRFSPHVCHGSLSTRAKADN